MQSKISHLDRLDALRFIAANLVVLSHLIDSFLVRSSGYEAPLSAGNIDCWIGIIAVICFFILSGFVMAFSVSSTLARGRFSFYDYFARRFFRIFPVAWCSTLLMGLVVATIYLLDLPGLGASGFVLPGDKFGQANYLSMYNFLYSLFLPPSGYNAGWFNLPFWTLAYEFGFYILFGVYQQLKQDLGYRKTLLISGFTLLATFVYYIWNIKPELQTQPIITNFQHFIKCFPTWNFWGLFFIWCSGVWVFKITRINNHFEWNIAAKIIIASTLVILGSHYLLGVPFNYNFYPNISSYSDLPNSIFMTIGLSGYLLLLVYLTVVIRIDNKLIKLLAKLGNRYSFTLYATHYAVIYLLLSIFWLKLKFFTAIDYILIFVFVYITTNLLAYFLAAYFEDRNLWLSLYKNLINGRNKNLK